MFKKKRVLRVLASVGLILCAVAACAKDKRDSKKLSVETTESKNPVLWQKPDSIKSLNLFYGPGGKEHAPHTVYTFEKEDLDGTSPKFVARDENGVRWKVKMGVEARPETVAARLIWAVGYSSNEDYFLPEIRVENMPAHLHRGQNFVGPPGTVHDVRLKRYLEGEKKVGLWRWRDNPFVATKELNGLRVMMALVNNWDLKDDNNAIYREKDSGSSDGTETVYMVSDLGASFGTTGLNWTQKISKGNLQSFSHSKFISKVTPQDVDFKVPSRDAIIRIFDLPAYIKRLNLIWIGKRIPRDDVRWIDQLLAQLSHEQICDAFRAAGYTPDEVKGFAEVVEKRIVELGKI
jgi:hypothetical protein